MFLEGHSMSEEFKPIRITLSEEGFSRLEKIMKKASFRNYSSAIEECIRVVSDISDYVRPLGEFSEETAFNAFIVIATRMSRFTGKMARVK